LASKVGSETGARTEAPREILAAARRCFARSGYHGTSIKKIAAEAQIRSPSILHYHFASKEELFLAVAKEAFTDLTERATRIGLEVAEGPRGLGAVEAFFGLLDGEDDLSALMVECVAMGVRGQGAQDELGALMAGLERLVADGIRALLGSGAERLPLEPEHLATAVVDLLTGHAIRSALRTDREDLVQRRAAILTLLGQIRPAETKDEDHAPPRE
jgi:AcrR family transcriptional regulator